MANLTRVAPVSGQLTGGDSVTLTGTGFIGVSGVQFGGVAATNVTTVNNTTVTCITPPGSTAGTVDVLVTATSGNSTLARGFEYLIPAPVLTMVMPNTGPEAGGTSVTLTGAEFTDATRVTFGGTAATNLVFVSDTSLTCVVPAGGGTVDVIVETPNGNATLAGGFGYQPAPLPTPVVAAPTGVTAKADKGMVTVAWSEVTADPAVTTYTVTPTTNVPIGPDQAPPAPIVVPGDPPPTSVALPGLSNATYTFTVSATNSDGTSPESPRSPEVTVGKTQGTCATCFYYQPLPDGSGGLCRESAPAVLIVDPKRPPPDATAIWPVVQPGDWCGQYEPQS